jgi:hypothetical protein
MVITEISADEVLRSTREALGLPITTSNGFDDAMLAASLRRAAGTLCPCSPSTLVAAVLESLRYLINEDITMQERVGAAAEALIIGGDLLELNQVTTDDLDVKGTWVFLAPPGFVVRPDGSIFLIGIAPDEITPLPASLRARITYEGYARVLTPEPAEPLPAVLRDLGLVELSKSAWLKTPKVESATELRDSMLRRLEGQPPSGTVADVSILHSTRGVGYYTGRWDTPGSESGNYVARRPQAHGAPLWGFAKVADGVVVKFLDFPLPGTRWRGCDVAWHLQMALDHSRGVPQFYRCRRDSTGACLDFFSPLPLWAQRRLVVLGRPATREKCLFSYWIPERELASEEMFLQQRLWLARSEKPDLGEKE